MNIGVILVRIGGVDGVALETEKWITVLERMGHNCFIATGELEADVHNAVLIPELSLFDDYTEKEQDDAFFNQDVEEHVIIERLEKQTALIQDKLQHWITENNIDVLLSENASTIPCHIALGYAIKRIIDTLEIPTVVHNHDFYWERGERYQSKYPAIQKVLEDCFPPKHPQVNHAVINLFGKDTLKRQKDIDAVVVPNVMDFNAPFALKDDYNADMLATLGLSEDDIPLFAVVRIVRRKGLEVAIDLIHRLSNPKIKLIITGSAKDDPRQAYLHELEQQVERLHLHKQVIFAEEYFDNVRTTHPQGHKVYSLHDAYAYSRGLPYFSTYEGFGNAYVEALLAKVPIFVNNYKPVYWPDIGSKGFKTVQLEDNQLEQHHVDKVKKILEDQQYCEEITSYNYLLGKKHFSFEVLEDLLKQIF